MLLGTPAWLLFTGCMCELSMSGHAGLGSLPANVDDPRVSQVKR
jgi:hypothetical protein